jgi:hypothetical protein
MSNLRTVVQSHRFTQELEAIEPSAQRADEFIAGAEWYLVRCPEVGTRMGQSDVWFLPSDDSAKMASMVIYYAFDVDRVVLLSICKAKLESGK